MILGTGGAKGRKKGMKGAVSKLSRHKWLSFHGILFFALALCMGVIGGAFFPREIFDDSGFVTQVEFAFEEPNPPPHISPPPLPPRPPSIEVALPRVAIILDDMGYNENLGEEFISFPLPLTFSFLPYAPFTRKLEALANESGRIVLLHLPMQSQNGDWDPGPGALYLHEEEEHQKAIFITDLSWVPHAVGVNNHMGSLYTENEQAMRNLLGMIREKGLFFIDSVTSPQSLGSQLALEMGLKTARRQIFLDNIHSEDKIHRQLEKLVETAKRQGEAIGIGHPHPETLQALTDGIPFLTANVRLVGVDALLHEKN